MGRDGGTKYSSMKVHNQLGKESISNTQHTFVCFQFPKIQTGYLPYAVTERLISRFLINVGTGYNFMHEIKFPPVSASFEYLFPSGPSLGAYLVHARTGLRNSIYSSGNFIYVNDSFSMFVLGAKAAWNWNARQNILPYFGILVGYEISEHIRRADNSNVESSQDLNSLTLGANTGIRFFFNNNVGAFVDAVINMGLFGSDRSGIISANLGIALKF